MWSIGYFCRTSRQVVELLDFFAVLSTWLVCEDVIRDDI